VRLALLGRFGGDTPLIEIDGSSGSLREIPDPHANGNLNPPASIHWPGHLALVICGPLREARLAARMYRVSLHSPLETNGVIYACAPLRHEQRVRRWFAEGVRTVEEANMRKGSPLDPGELAPGTLIGWASRFHSFSGLVLNLLLRCLISAGIICVVWFLVWFLFQTLAWVLLEFSFTMVVGKIFYRLSPLFYLFITGLFAIEFLPWLWQLWARLDRLREGPTRDQWAPVLAHIVIL
jgi:hypothetical protein